MKKILFCLLLACGFAAEAQVYNNEWIDYSKPYYKFKVGKNGVFRISQATLSTAGLSSVPAEQFQLWRNGQQVAIYTSIPSGVFSSSDYIEFWGQMNDGRPDNELYRDPAYQLNNKWSLETDTAAYFLTVNSFTDANLRIINTANNVSGNTLPADPYFMYTFGNYFRHRVIKDTLINGQLVNDTLLNHPQQAFPRPNKDLYISRLNAGYAINVGEYLYSSSYDRGEGWSSPELISEARILNPNTPQRDTIIINGVQSQVIKNLFVYPGGPDPKFLISASGNSVNTRRYKVQLNSDSIMGHQMDFFTYRTDSVTFPLSLLNSNRNIVTVTNIANVWCYSAPTNCQTDRMTIHKYEITYPRQFNFGGEKNFEFMLPANPNGNFLQITNFNYGTAAPVLYDLSNNMRYTADLSAAPTLQFVLQPSDVARHLVLVNSEASNITSVISMQRRDFVDYSAPQQHGDYLIITNPALFNGQGGNNPVSEYSQYRSSAAGGHYTTRIYHVDEIIDQFGFGIKRNPAGLRNFVRYARHNFSIKPKHLFLVGRGVNYVHHRANEMGADMDKLNLVPPFGWPASDVLLTAEPGSSQPELSVGRLSAVTPQEVSVYLKKVKEFEAAQTIVSPSSEQKSWSKNVVHIVGAGEPGLEGLLSTHLDSYEQIIEDTLFGGHVSKFSKTSSNAVEQLNNTRLQHLFDTGINVITYFGHSSSTTLEFNLDNPENYNNYGKYPMFIGLGCNAGNFFNYTPSRLVSKETLSEKYVLAPDRGTIGFIASTHFGIVHYLDLWAKRAYQNMASKLYGKTMGEIMKATAEDVFAFTTQEDFYARCNTEESELHGDPAIRLNPHPKPDYVIEDPMVRVRPGFVSVAEDSFYVDAHFLNIGRAVDRSIVVEVKRQVLNGTPEIIRRDTIPGTRYMDTIQLRIPINPINDKGLNKLYFSIDADNNVDEAFENNNTLTKEIMIYEDEARPVFPYNFAIINQQNIKFMASTANPFASSKQYIMEIDTTEQFNSSAKITSTVTSPGGVMEFNPSISFVDSMVYYWRVAPASATGDVAWNKSSFVYLANSEPGFNQSHFFQHTKSKGQQMSLDSASRDWKFGSRFANIFVRQGSWVTSTGQEAGVSVAVNGSAAIRNTCAYQSVVFNVFDPVNFKPWSNAVPPGTPTNYYGGGRFGSATTNCFNGRANNFEYRWDSVSSRKRAMDFMDSIPDGSYVVVRSFLLDPNTFPAFSSLVKYAPDWKADTSIWGSGRSLYHSLLNAGFAAVDSFSRPRQFAMIYKKNDPSFAPKWVMTNGTADNVTLTADCAFPDTSGMIFSPKFGPAKEWKELKWSGRTKDILDGDNPRVDIIGIRNDGQGDTLVRNIRIDAPVTDVSWIPAAIYPYVQLRMKNSDTVNLTPYQLRYWMLTTKPAPEGAIAPNWHFSMTKDTFDIAEPLDFKIAFRNVSTTPFDSLKVKMVITDRNNIQHVLPVQRHRPLGVGNYPDTLHVRFPIDTRTLVGSNSLLVEINPDNDQPEQYHFNNIIYRQFFVRGDTLNPLLDVTFDNVHILNGDIVSAKPNILIKLKDEAKWFLLNDASRMQLKVIKEPTNNDPGWTRDYNFGTDTLEFVPAQQAPNADNTATAIFRPHFTEDGTYELKVLASDMSHNEAGKMEYRVSFNVINKPMISNMLNYPNPFTTSTAFVFTLTGTVVPQNIRIQILTVTGKVVREITKEELGPLRIGRNITEYKWDGTDQYGQKLGNGVYLYRVITNLNGKSLDKYTSSSDDTDQYFNKGYGKMYLMR